ncbi:MAG: GAF domain-containing protein [Actinomycetota bacterium]|nr:GAF domain-containing protein [Actinomycetota bacterium]
MTTETVAVITRALESGGSRTEAARAVADAVRAARGYRWVGVYDVDESEVAIIAWSGAGPPAHPRFARTDGLTGAAVASGETVVANDVTSDARYLDAFGDTRAEVIVPVRGTDGVVRGTIDVESDIAHAFSARDLAFLEACARAARPLWPASPTRAE